MQRVSAFLPSWDKRQSVANKPNGFFAWTHRNSLPSGAPRTPARINTAAANGQRHQREAFWPGTLDVECDKAARILRSFCTDGYLAPQDVTPASSDEPPPSPALVPNKIPRPIIQNAAGIAVFSCMRSGLWMTGSGGSGILIARKSDGTWSPPSGILLHTPTLSFIIGVDIYDCVLVINNLAALESITRSRVTLGEDVALTNGPSAPLHSDDSHVNWREFGNTVLAYMKARGQRQAVNLNGCILAERTNENERFYDSTVSQMDILAGNVNRSVDETKPLFEVIKMAEGRSDFDASIINQISLQSAPGDAVIATPKSPSAPSRPSFGIPEIDDPDPFGVLALEMAGLEIREAGTRLRPSSSQFEFGVGPLSPALSKFSRQSVETFATRSNRGSVVSAHTAKSHVTDAYTQTDLANTPETSPSPGQSDDGSARERMPDVKEDDEVDYTRIDLSPLQNLGRQHSIDFVLADDDAAPAPMAMLAVPGSEESALPSVASSIYDTSEDPEEINDADDEDDMDDEVVEEPVVIQVAAVQPTSTRAIASRVIQARGNVVTIQKRLPPPLPVRSPARTTRAGKPDAAVEVISVPSPLRQASNDADYEPEAGDEAEHPTDDGAEADETILERSVSSESTVAGKARQQRAASDGSRRADECGPSVEDGAVPASETMSHERPDAEKSEAARDQEGVREDMHPAREEAMTNVDRKEQTDNSDSATYGKHTSSVYTGVTEDRWSCDGSSVTTPTSEQRYSMSGEANSDTPTKMPREEHEAGKTSPPAVTPAPSLLATT
ncbi:hypothetical protein XA68_13005 [Ophiocordyceps unilateralis]|uniref:Ysc84 actin-binding domain-containing protein n=1 Tax=Ophiocordyceps unilateralis TaxID=268505 RepID=A0A2A9PM61_OPHUN|nr:hypothetical protein XA68_13005 [Ophiocordyceps unilateralis]